MSHYHDPADLKLLAEFKKLAPAEFKGFVELDSIVGRDDGKIPRKYRELIAIAVACTTQCPYCLDVHTRNAKKAGATREEVAEAALLVRRAAGRGRDHPRRPRAQAVRPGLSARTGGRAPRRLRPSDGARPPRRAPSAPASARAGPPRCARGAVAGEPARNGGCGSYSMPSWMAWATSSPAMRAASVSAMSMPDETPAAVIDLALLHHALERGARAVARAGGRATSSAWWPRARSARRRRRAASSRCTPTWSTGSSRGPRGSSRAADSASRARACRSRPAP